MSVRGYGDIRQSRLHDLPPRQNIIYISDSVKTI